MNDSDILDQMGNLRVALELATENVRADDHAGLLVAVSIFIAGFDAMLSMRES
jgi:hypothetical protein